MKQKSHGLSPCLKVKAQGRKRQRAQKHKNVLCAKLRLKPTIALHLKKVTVRTMFCCGPAAIPHRRERTLRRMPLSLPAAPGLLPEGTHGIRASTIVLNLRSRITRWQSHVNHLKKGILAKAKERGEVLQTVRASCRMIKMPRCMDGVLQKAYIARALSKKHAIWQVLR